MMGFVIKLHIVFLTSKRMVEGISETVNRIKAIVEKTLQVISKEMKKMLLNDISLDVLKEMFKKDAGIIFNETVKE